MSKRGKREYVQVLRLMETFSQQEVHQGVKDALRLGTIGPDAVGAPAPVPYRTPSPETGPVGLPLPSTGPG